MSFPQRSEALPDSVQQFLLAYGFGLLSGQRCLFFLGCQVGLDNRVRNLAAGLSADQVPCLKNLIVKAVRFLSC